MVIGPWGHGPSQKFGEMDFGPTAFKSIQERELRWFDHYLKGVDNGIDREPPVTIFYMGANKWQQAQDWPLVMAQMTQRYTALLGRSAAPALMPPAGRGLALPQLARHR